MRRPRALAAALAAVLLLHVVLILPARPEAPVAATVFRLPIELPIIVALLLLARGRVVRAAVTALALVVLVLKIADLGTFGAFGRPFNPALDLHLLAAGWSLLEASVGRAEALGAVALACAGVAAFAAALWGALSGAARLEGAWRVGAGAVAVLALAAGLAARPSPLVTADLVPGLRARAERMAHAAADLRAFAASLPDDPVGSPTFAALGGRDVIVLFVESYGRSFVEAPRFARAAQDAPRRRRGIASPPRAGTRAAPGPRRRPAAARAGSPTPRPCPACAWTTRRATIA